MNQLFCLEGLEELRLTIKFVKYNFIHVVLEYALANEEEDDEKEDCESADPKASQSPTPQQPNTALSGNGLTLTQVAD